VNFIKYYRKYCCYLDCCRLWTRDQWNFNYL